MDPRLRGAKWPLKIDGFIFKSFRLRERTQSREGKPRGISRNSGIRTSIRKLDLEKTKNTWDLLKSGTQNLNQKMDFNTGKISYHKTYFPITKFANTASIIGPFKVKSKEKAKKYAIKT